MDVIKKEIERIVDIWTNEVLNTILSSKTKPRGIWDRFKGGLSNIWYGRDNKENPYYWKNKFGDDLGVKESFDPRAFSLREYSFLKNTIENTEKKINEEIDPEMEKLKIVKIIKDYAQQLKNDIYNFFLKTRKETNTVASSAKTGSGQDGASASQSVPAKSKETNDSPVKTGSSQDGGNQASVSQSVATKSKETTDAPIKTSDSTSGVSPKKSDSSNSSAGSSVVDKSDDADSSSDSKEPVQSSSSVQKNTKEASELKRTNPESLSPNLSWLTKTGRIKAQKIPWAIAWLSLRPHLDINSDEDVERELKNVNLVGKEFSDAFAGLVSKNKNRKGTIIKNLKIWFSSDALFEKALKELGVEEYSKSSGEDSKSSGEDSKSSGEDSKSSGEDSKSSGEDSKSSGEDSKSSGEDSKSSGEDSKSSGEDDLDENMNLLSSLYKNKDKQETLNSIKKKLIMPIARTLDQEDKIKFSIWWNRFKERSESNDLESLIASIKSEDLFKDITDNVGSKKINFNDLFNLLKT